MLSYTIVEDNKYKKKVYFFLKYSEKKIFFDVSHELVSNVNLLFALFMNYT